MVQLTVNNYDGLVCARRSPYLVEMRWRRQRFLGRRLSALRADGGYGRPDIFGGDLKEWEADVTAMFFGSSPPSGWRVALNYAQFALQPITVLPISGIRHGGDASGEWRCRNIAGRAARRLIILYGALIGFFPWLI